MLRLPPFTYLSPQNIGEALRLMGEHGSDAMFVAGGTDLFPNMKRRQFEPKVLIGLRRLPELKQFSNSGGLTLGAGITLTHLANLPDVLKSYPALAMAAGLVSTPQLRNMGTYGGNLCLDTRCNYYNQSYFWREALGFCMKKDATVCRVALSSPICLAAHSADTAPVLTVLDASVTIRSAGGERQVNLANLYRNDGMTFLKLERDEILTDIHVPAPD